MPDVAHVQPTPCALVTEQIGQWRCVFENHIFHLQGFTFKYLASTLRMGRCVCSHGNATRSHQRLSWGRWQHRNSRCGVPLLALVWKVCWGPQKTGIKGQEVGDGEAIQANEVSSHEPSSCPFLFLPMSPVPPAFLSFWWCWDETQSLAYPKPSPRLYHWGTAPASEI